VLPEPLLVLPEMSRIRTSVTGSTYPAPGPIPGCAAPLPDITEMKDTERTG
jgi:hypothetical protein